MSSTSCSDSVSRVTVLIALMLSTEPTTLPQRKLSSFLLASLNDSFTHVYSFENVHIHTAIQVTTTRTALSLVSWSLKAVTAPRSQRGQAAVCWTRTCVATGEAAGDDLLVVSFGQGAGVHAGELVHSQVEELVQAELCLHATAAHSRATKRASSRSPAGHRRSTQARRLHWPYDTSLNHAVLVMGYDVRRREN